MLHFQHFGISKTSNQCFKIIIVSLKHTILTQYKSIALDHRGLGHVQNQFLVIISKDVIDYQYNFSQLVRIGSQLLGPNTPFQWEMTFQLKSQQPNVPEV